MGRYKKYKDTHKGLAKDNRYKSDMLDYKICTGKAQARRLTKVLSVNL